MQGGLLSSFIWPTYPQGRGPTLKGINWKRPTFCLLSSYLAPTYPQLYKGHLSNLSLLCVEGTTQPVYAFWGVEPIRRQLKIVGLFQYIFFAGPPVARECYDTFSCHASPVRE
jgi:hypothetical protein